MRLFRNANYEFLGRRRQAYFVSGVIILVGLVSIFLHRGLNAGVEFTGGTLVQIRFSEQTTVAELRDVLATVGFGTAQIQQLRGSGLSGGDSGQEFMFRVPVFQQTGEGGVLNVMQTALEDRFGADSYELERVEAVGPRVGGELQVKATYAILLSFLLTLIYLAFRFEWRFGVAAVIATVHDILITFGFISLVNIEITLATVAAILTIVGYSLNDTIVVFDRGRENIRKKRKEPYAATLNRSINETLPRTVLTSGTTLVALLSLYVLGGAVIRPFALVLIAGILVGTYSSIFVASPALLEIQEHRRRRAKHAQATG
jgi:preprotein translocase subunit SecF